MVILLAAVFAAGVWPPALASVQGAALDRPGYGNVPATPIEDCIKHAGAQCTGHRQAAGPKTPTGDSPEPASTLPERPDSTVVRVGIGPVAEANVRRHRNLLGLPHKTGPPVR